MIPQATRPALRAPAMEVFATIQGEGAFVGEPQVLLRLRGCPLRCRWCDTRGSWRLGPDPGWTTAESAARRIEAADGGQGRTLSVTGGEPLLWPDFLLELRRRIGRRIHLETAGAHPAALERVLEAVDHVSLDLKLPADLDAPVSVEGGRDGEPVPATASEWAQVRGRVLPLVGDRDACAKIVVAGGRSPRAFAPILDDVARLAPRLPLYLQPATPIGGVERPGPDELEAVVEAALARGLPVRVVPQIHRVLGMP